jgi:oligopeptidase B
MPQLDPQSPPPLAPRRPTTLSTNGTARTDDWFWLRDREDPGVRAYLDAENAYTDAAFAGTGDLRDQLYTEMLGRIQETDLGVPERRDNWLYYNRTEQGQQYTILCRKLDAPDAVEEVLLDQNALARDQPYFRLGAFAPSPDHTLLAFSTDTDGNEKFDLVVKNLATGALLGDRIENIAAGAEWSADGRYLFYATLDETQRPWQVRRHELQGELSQGSTVDSQRSTVDRRPSTSDNDPIVFEEPDARFFVGLDTTRSRRFIRIYASSHSASEVLLLDTERPLDPPRVVIPRQPLVEYTVEHHEDHLYIVTNDGAENFRLVEALVETPDEWTEVERSSVVSRQSSTDPDDRRPTTDDSIKLDNVDAFRDYLVIWERADATPRVTIRNLRTGDEHRVAFPEEVFSVQPGGNPEFDSDTVRFIYTSLVTPPSVIDYHMATRAWEERKRQPVLGYDAGKYRTAREFATAGDGVRVPISLVWREGEIEERAARDARRETRDASPESRVPRPLLLRGYGAYGVNYDPVFSSNMVSLLDRGFVVAIAHIRGGEELGRPWYRHGKLLEKRNTFSDFIASAEHLVAAGWSRPDRLVIWGGSAGGLLVGAVVNQRPDLFAGAVAQVPFVDVLTTMLDESIPLTVMEYEEWGNPNLPEYFEYIRSYSPYDNVKRERYPAMLVTAGLNDPRVGFWEPAKWVAKLRTMKTDSNPLLLRTHMGAGHSGASGRYDVLREVAEEYAFVIEVGKTGRREDGR